MTCGRGLWSDIHFEWRPKWYGCIWMDTRGVLARRQCRYVYKNCFLRLQNYIFAPRQGRQYIFVSHLEREALFGLSKYVAKYGGKLQWKFSLVTLLNSYKIYATLSSQKKSTANNFGENARRFFFRRNAKNCRRFFFRRTFFPQKFLKSRQNLTYWKYYFHMNWDDSTNKNRRNGTANFFSVEILFELNVCYFIQTWYYLLGESDV